MTLTEGKTDSLSVVLQHIPPSGTEKKPAPVIPKKKGFDRIAALIAVGVLWYSASSSLAWKCTKPPNRKQTCPAMSRNN